MPTKIKEKERNQVVVGSPYNYAHFIAEKTEMTGKRLYGYHTAKFQLEVSSFNENALT